MTRFSRLATRLELRATIKRLRKCPHPLRAAYQVLWPFPWQLQTPKRQVTPTELQIDEKLRNQLQNGIEQLRAIPLFRIRDTPIRSLYRLYEDICANQLSSLCFEMEYFYFQPTWKLEDIPDPKDGDRERYTVLACLAEELARAINWRLSLGLLRSGKTLEFDGEPGQAPYTPVKSPSWAQCVPALTRPLYLANCTPLGVVGNGLAREDLGKNAPSPGFWKRNIKAATGSLYTV